MTHGTLDLFERDRREDGDGDGDGGGRDNGRDDVTLLDFWISLTVSADTLVGL